ncbi:MAG: FeoB-associated Cys-rich membrane protein [Eubacterium sp.]|nr:FeoB-associated Cys-rich membrane protein [Eubacterium sp.]
MEWIVENLGTILITALLILIVTGIVLGIIKNKKNGRSSCGGNCAHCNMCASCRTKKL